MRAVVIQAGGAVCVRGGESGWSLSALMVLESQNMAFLIFIERMNLHDRDEPPALVSRAASDGVTLSKASSARNGACHQCRASVPQDKMVLRRPWRREYQKSLFC